MSNPSDKRYEIGGAFRCCIASLEDAEIPPGIAAGHRIACRYCACGMTWTGAVWRASWCEESHE